MCGITGFWKPKGLSDRDDEHLTAMMTTLHHRGPDGNGRHLDAPYGLAMGHTRLTVIDLHTGKQPLFSHDRKHVLTANGELYDYKQKRAELARRGVRFETKSDSEVTLVAYGRYGLDFFEHLRGEFAFALFDYKKDELYLVRDRFGIKPLYFHATSDGLYWGSEVKAILAHPEVPRKIAFRPALNQMMHTMVPGTTAFEGIEALKPGCFLRVRREGERLVTSQHRYWDMDFLQASEHDKKPDPTQYVDGTAEHLIDAVRVRLEADVPVGCYLSGGIDSCSILGLATAMQQSPVRAFTISFDHSAYDEASIAREMALKAGAQQEILSLGAEELYGAHYVKTLWHAERTFYNTLGVAKWHMSRRVRECGYKVVVTGEGSDEMFAGYPFFKRDYFAHAPEGSADARALQEKLDVSNAVFKGAILAEAQAEHPVANDVVGFTPAWIQPWILTLAEARPLLSKSATEQLEGYDPVASIFEALDPSQLRGRHPLDKAQYSWIKTMLEGQILTWGGDRVDMANSMEARPAFLDHHLAEYARTIPPSMRIHGRTEKYVLREAMRGLLPDVLYRREKFAFMAPPAHTDEHKRRALQQLADRHLSEDRMRDTGLLDIEGVRSVFALHDAPDTTPATRVQLDAVINHLIGIQILHQQFVAADLPRRAVESASELGWAA
jgi:asparagine synthase (glutamine-hydrolysing)